MTKQSKTTCDECGRSMAKATRIEDGFAYCGTCYARQFKSVCCLSCKKPQRIHVNATTFNCRSCAAKEELCARCQKPTYGKVGKRIGKNAICNSCSYHFRSKTNATDTLPTPSVFKATCKRCRKHRVIKAVDFDGNALCKDCLPSQEVSHNCPTCNTIVAGAGNSECARCNLITRAKKRCNLNKELFEQQWCQQLFIDFVVAALIPTANTNISKVVDRYALAFKKLDRSCRSSTEIFQELLFQLFGGEGLRTHSLMINYFITALGLSWSADKLESLIENARIESKLAEFAEEPWHDLVTDYIADLTDEKPDNQKLQPRTVRTYLNAAIKFLAQVDLTDYSKIGEQHFVGYIQKNPGQHASLTAFRRFLGIEQIKKPNDYPKTKSLPKNSKQVINQCQGLLDMLKQKDLSLGKRKALLCGLIHLLFDVPVEHILKLEIDDFEQDRNQLVFRNYNLALNEDLGKCFKELLRQSLMANSKYIFYGKNLNQPMSTATYKFHTRVFQFPPSNR